MARAGELPVNVRVLVEGEEECGGESVAAWVRADERRADAAIVVRRRHGRRGDARDHGRPARHRDDAPRRCASPSATSTRGCTAAACSTRCTSCTAILAPVVPGPDGRVREELREGVPPPAAAELASWTRLPPGDAAIAEAGGRPVHPGARRRVLRAQRRRRLARRQRDRRRRAAHGRAGGRARRRCRCGSRPARIPTACTPCSRGCCASALPGRRRARDRLTTARCRCCSTPTQPALRLAADGADARLRRRAGVRAHRRHDPDRGRDGRARLPGDRERLRAARGRDPRARRVLRAAQPRAGARRPRASSTPRSRRSCAADLSRRPSAPATRRPPTPRAGGDGAASRRSNAMLPSS